jgi:spore coat protein CotH
MFACGFLWRSYAVVPPPAPGADLFALTNVPAFVIEIDAAGLRSLRNEPRTKVKATVRLGGELFRDVGVHIKGSQGSLQTIDARPALTLSFNKFVPKQKCHGLRKLHLNNSAEDPTFMTDVLCSELFRQAGVPSARGAYATLELNRRKLGLYVLKEGLTKEFLAQYFRRTDGNLYDGGFRRDVDRPLERIHGDGPDDQADRLALLAAAREPEAARRWQRLQEVLDLDRFITSLALQTITWNWDGYAMARNNYRIYHDSESGKLVFIPHGLDQMFWEPQGTIYPRMQGLVASAVMRVPEGRSLYRARLASLHTNRFKVAALTSRVNELAALIEPYFPQAPAAAAKLRRLIIARSRSIAEQLQPPDP